MVADRRCVGDAVPSRVVARRPADRVRGSDPPPGRRARAVEGLRDQCRRDGAGAGQPRRGGRRDRCAAGVVAGWHDARLRRRRDPPRDPAGPMPTDISRQIEIVTATHGPDGWVERVVVPPSAVWMSAFSNVGSPDRLLPQPARHVLGRPVRRQHRRDRGADGVRPPCQRVLTVLEPRRPGHRDAHGPDPPGGQEVGFGWPNQAYTLFPVGGGAPSESPRARVDAVFACSWQRLAPGP